MTSEPGALALPTPQQGTSLSLQVNSVDDLQRLARLFAASGLFGRPGANPDAFMAECAIKLLVVMEAGFPPSAAGGVTVINGRPGFGSNLLAQAIKRHPGYDYRVLEKTDRLCRIRFLYRGEELGVESFTIEMAERAGLTKSGGPWKQYPEAMLFARCLSAGMRTHCPDALGAHAAYTPEELGAKGAIDQNGMVAVTVTEHPRPATLSSPEELAAGAQRACEARGMTPDGIQALASELSHGETTILAALPANILARLAKSGVTAETAARCNAAGEAMTVAADDDDIPAAWAA